MDLKRCRREADPPQNKEEPKGNYCVGCCDEHDRALLWSSSKRSVLHSLASGQDDGTKEQWHTGGKDCWIFGLGDDDAIKFTYLYCDAMCRLW